ncbi:MAG TPA: alpha-amylase family glycosyl hydrolase [Gemmatimonadales bacterium]|nr:alpha-amylase family glycosyl hydrolase [Gemmatimonadales bacterium]
MASRISQVPGLIAWGFAGLIACSVTPGPDGNGRGGAPATVSASAIYWNSATIYFLLTDRFRNGDPTNDLALGRAHDGALLRSFEGGDLAGIHQKIDEGYFDSLGVSAIWLTPFVEQIHGSVDEGTGKTYGYHGYWTRDWTAVDPAFGSREELHAMVDAAHRHGIRVIMDAVINHTGPTTASDPAWPAGWVRAGPTCTYHDYATTVDCNLVATLPDVRTESDSAVPLPPTLVAKWRMEGRLDQETASLDAWFQRTGHPRAPRYYIIKWLTDWVREFGFDGYRIDTAKHFGEGVSQEIRSEADQAYADWKRAHPGLVMDSLPFYMVGEVYGWGAEAGRDYDYGDRKVDFFAHGYDGLINFAFAHEPAGALDDLFSRYATLLHDGSLRGVTFLNYLSSHDDGAPFDRDRKDPQDDADRLLLAPGTAQIYYGDESSRPLVIAGAEGDANLRSPMNWGDVAPGGGSAAILRHWRIVARFRHAHPAVGAGVHRTLQASPYIFSRTLEAGGKTDRVIVAMDQGQGARVIPVFAVFPDGTELVDAYSGARGTVVNGKVSLATGSALVLLSTP